MGLLCSPGQRGFFTLCADGPAWLISLLRGFQRLCQLLLDQSHCVLVCLSMLIRVCVCVDWPQTSSWGRRSLEQMLHPAAEGNVSSLAIPGPSARVSPLCCVDSDVELVFMGT